MKKMIWLLLLFFAVFAQRATAQCNLDVNVPTPPPLSCTDTVVTVSVNVNPPTGIFSYFWYGQGLTLGTNPTVSIFQPGTYFVSVFDSLTGCSGLDTFSVTQDGSLPVVTLSITPENCSASGTGTITATSNNPLDTYQWSNGATTNAIDAPAGFYCVTVSNPSGCSATSCITMVVPPPVTVEIWYINAGFCGDSLGMWAAPAGGQWPYQFIWNNGSTNNWVAPPVMPGFYAVTVTDANGCSATASYFVEQDPTECGAISGNVFADFNNDCLLTAGEQGLHGFTVQIENAAGDDIFAYTDNNGDYIAYLEPGPYLVSIVINNPDSPWTPCETSYLVDVPPSTTVDQNIPLQAENLCPALEVDISINFLRRCNNNNYYWVSYSNNGTADAANAYVELSFDPFLTIQAAEIPYTDLGNHLYRFDLGNVSLNSTGGFWVRVAVSCNAVLGQTHCVDAIIFPHDPCPSANPNWSGAGVELTADCSGGELRFHARNPSAFDMTVPLDYVIIEDAIMLMMTPGTPLTAGENRLVFTAPANGATWRIESNQEPFYPGQSTPSLSVEGCAGGQTFSTGFVNQFETDDLDPWIDIDCRENVASYDPNDKQAFPRGYGAEHYIKRGVDLEYLIRFQNTGTDTAFLVVIRDTLSAALDPGSVVPGASSHPYRFDYYGDGALKFTFENILLPDSSTNLEASQGFVSFKVKQRDNLPLETNIFNTAAIYFDGNAPVLTNTTQHRIGENFVTVDTWTPAASGLELSIAPNPAFDYALLQLKGLPLGTEWQVELLDATGRKVLSENLSDNQLRLERGTLPAGLYLLRASANGQLLGTGKLMLR